MENAPPAMVDFRAYFQLQRAGQLPAQRLFPAKGVICIWLEAPDIRQALAAEMDAIST
jgi:hypothetical protein